MPYQASDLKRKLREIKRLEILLRFNGDRQSAQGKLVWEDFFSFKASEPARFHLDELVEYEREALKDIIDEYFYNVYFRIYNEKGLSLDSLFDPSLLSLLGLPPYSTGSEIKSRFRELAKKFHPDLGGDSEKFIDLMRVYERLMGE